MKRTFFDVKTAAAPVLCFMIIFSLGGCAMNTGDSNSQLTDTDVQIIAMNSDATNSSYQVGATLSSTAFSSINQIFEDKITQEWKTYDGMTKEAKTSSSHLWGIVYFETDTWKEFEEAIGFSVNNPLEALSWLDKTGYTGMESADPSTPIKHVEVRANTANVERKLSEISATSGYNTASTRITLTATLLLNAGTYTTDCAYNGKATYEQDTATTGSGIPVLTIITTDGTNNAGYCNGGYYDSTAYWVKDNVFYTLRVIGDSADKTEILATFDRILEKI